MFKKIFNQIMWLGCLSAMLFGQLSLIVFAQTNTAVIPPEPATDAAIVPTKPTEFSRYIDQTVGMTEDEAVAFAFANNDELAAARKEIEAARALVKQSRFRPNPSVEVNRAEQIGGSDNNFMVAGSLPLELGNRRKSRINVAEAELTLREKTVADRERLLAAEVRMKFWETVAQTIKLNLTEDLLTASLNGFRLVQGRVVEGKIAPLEENMTLVEVNRLRSLRETEAGKTDITMLEFRNQIGMKSDEPLRLRADFKDSLAPLPSLGEATQQALQTRPDLQAMRAMENVAEAQIEQARAGGRFDASLTAGYQRMNSSFPVNGITETGALSPVQDVFHFFNFGIMLEIPVRNRNQGAIEAAIINADAAKKRREFAELVVKREVATAFARYESVARAMEIFRVGVRDQANTNLGVVRQTYELGARNLIDYLVEERRFIELETEYIDVQLAVHQARVEIKRATSAPVLITK
ncbi:MAG: TolC family protein [Acidobacteriota bacterium]|nr:TolC family protein [Acidobacteriota bacterium]